MLVIILLALLVLRLFYVSYRAGSTFSALMTVGIAGMFMFQSFQNILMCLGMFPVVGVTLPLFSYGGTSVVTMYIALGVAAGVKLRRKTQLAPKVIAAPIIKRLARLHERLRVCDRRDQPCRLAPPQRRKFPF